MKSTDGAGAHDEHVGRDEAGRREPAAQDERLGDVAFERLRAADPAADVVPDLTALRASVDAATGGTARTAGTAPERPAEAAGAPAVVAGSRRRSSARWFQLAAVSAGVLAVGFGGYALGQAGGDAAPSAQEQTAEPAVGGPGGDLATGDGGTADSRAVSPESASAAADTKIAPGWGARTTFASVGLDDTPGRAHAWAFDPSAVFSDATVARLAAALGASGKPELTYGSWRVGPADWSGPVVELSSDSQTSFFFSDPALDPWSEDGAAQEAPTVEEAQTLLTDLMATLGVDSAGFELESLDEMQSPGSRSVTAHQVVDGQRTGVRWDLMATQGGVYSVNGQLAPLVDLGEYDVVGAQSAVARLGDPRFGSSGGDVIAYARDMSVASDVADPAVGPDVAWVDPTEPADPAAVPELPVAPQPGTAFAWPVQSVTITGATLATGVFYQPDGGAVLLPAYTFTDGSGAQWSTVAVADAHLDFAPRG